MTDETIICLHCKAEEDVDAHEEYCIYNTAEEPAELNEADDVVVTKEIA